MPSGVMLPHGRPDGGTGVPSLARHRTWPVARLRP
jgi:hypothetical protein